MAGYADTRQMIIDTLMGRMAGTEIQPEDHQRFALQITEYIRSVELVAGNATPIGFADADTVPVQPDNGQAVYLSSVGGAQTVVFSNFIDQNGDAISVTSTTNVIKLVTLLWNGQYWDSQVTSVNAVRDTTDGYLFMGVATPSTNPGTPDQKCFYLAGSGTYTYFSSIVVNDGELAILKYNGNWAKLSIPNIVKNPIFENGELYNVIVGIQTNFVFDSMRLTQLYNRTIAAPAKSQFMRLNVTINGTSVNFDYYSEDGTISSANEVIELTSTNETYYGLKIWVWVRWGGIELSIANSHAINTFSVSYPQSNLLNLFGTHVTNNESFDELIGLYTNFDFSSLTLTRLYNRNNASSSQIITFHATINGQDVTFNGVFNNSSAHTGLHSYVITQGNYEIGVLMNWKSVHEDASLNYIIFKEKVNVIPAYSSGNVDTYSATQLAKDLVQDGQYVVPVWTQNKYINTSGQEVAAGEQLAVTDFISLPPTLESIELSNIGSFSLANAYSFYNEDKEYISGASGAITHIGTIPNGAKYIRLSSLQSDSDWSDNKYLFSAFSSLTSIGKDVEVINKSSRVMVATDIEESSGTFNISNGSLFASRVSTDPHTYILFKETIRAIEFDIVSLWDSNFITLAFGSGVDNQNVDCFAGCYLPTSLRPNEIGSVGNDNSSTSQFASIYGEGHYSGNYRDVQTKPAAVAVGDHCRIELTKEGFFLGQIWNTEKLRWKFWFCLDTLGDWNIPLRYGWNEKKRIGFGVKFNTFTNKELVSNLKVVSEDNTYLEINFNLQKNLPIKKMDWVAVGDSLTAIDKNNGLSYVGFASRENNLRVNNQGKGGWTIYKYWRDRATAGWEDAVSELPDDGIVTILMGTNDFDTKSYSTPASDSAMDAAENPHPRFGTTDASSDTAKDTHTTLGCLRLIIERILELKPTAKLYVFAPFYREKGTNVGSTSWLKDLYVNSDGKTIYDYANAIVSVASEYNLPSFNTAKECGINALTLATYTYDDLHINQRGGELIGHYVAQKIK